MNLSISATNPCHLWPLARELSRIGELDAYYSGYPRWRLPDQDGVPVRSHPMRTLVVYSLLRYVPERYRPGNRSLFLWQDRAFDRWVARSLTPCDFIHALPGQAKLTFTRARAMGVRTVLNHATGPVRNLQNLILPEYRRLGLNFEDHSALDAAYLEREREEYGLTDYHCVASTIVRDQLVEDGVQPDRIWLVPYGADTSVWRPPSPSGEPEDPSSPFKIMFAGQLSLRKGLRFLLEALAEAGDQNWQLDCYGPVLEESRLDREAYRGTIPVHYHGPVSASKLAAAMQRSNVLVLPSLEEGFGLVVPQALSCGLPCLVSDAVGAKDLIAGFPHRGDVFPSGNSREILLRLENYNRRRGQSSAHQELGSFNWSDSAKKLAALSAMAC